MLPPVRVFFTQGRSLEVATCSEATPIDARPLTTKAIYESALLSAADVRFALLTASVGRSGDVHAGQRAKMPTIIGFSYFC